MTANSTHAIRLLLLLILGVAVLYFAKPFLVPLCFGAVLAMLFLPVSKWLEGKRLPRGPAALCCILILLAGMAGTIALLDWQISSLAQDAPKIEARILDATDTIQAWINAKFNIPVEEQNDMLKEKTAALTSVAATAVGSTLEVVVSFVLVVVYFFLLLFYRHHIKVFFTKVFPQTEKQEVRSLIFNAAKVSQQYLWGLTKMIVVLWIMYGIGFSIIGVKNAIFFAVLCGLLEMVPFIGNLTGSLLTVLFSVADGGGAGMVVSILITYGSVQFIQTYILEPLIVGAQVHINPLFTIIALVIGELIWGIPGMILAIPSIGMFKIACDHIEPLKPYGFLIGEIPNEQQRPLFRRLSDWILRRSGQNDEPR